MKKFIIFSIIIVLSAFLSFKYIYIIRNEASVYTGDGISYIAKVDNTSFYIYSYGKWEKSFIKGVNIGAAKPGTFPGELAITKEEYLRWFKQIADMNADKIRVYTILKPEFYDALYDYNRTSLKPIYIFQGTWINEDDLAELQDAHNPIIKNGFKEDIKTLIDIIHGKAEIEAKRGHASGVYKKDVSPYVMGWILGLEWDPEFVENTNEINESLNSFDGKINTYKAYLKDLIKEHTVPVLVAEFGIPASRGKAHENIHMGYNQGDIDEKSQGEMDAAMLQDIYDEGYAGGLVFTWQDEWFKRTWNTMDLDLPDKRAYWSNPQTNEQEFGILAFDPGEDKSICYVDGDISDWKRDKPLVDTSNMKLYVKSDEKYLYIMGDIKGFDFQNDKVFLPIDITPYSGNLKYNDYNLTFKRPTDMVIVLDNKEGSRIVTDSYYDTFYYLYSKQLKMIDENTAYEKKDSGIFNPIYLCLNRSLFLPEDEKTLPLEKYETGKLILGDANPEHKDYNSLADYAVNKDKVEIRIPWQLLNVMDPSTKMIMDDFNEKNKISSLKIEGLYIGGILTKNNVVTETSNMEVYNWNEWDIPTYHERLKPSYDILKKAFKSIGK